MKPLIRGDVMWRRDNENILAMNPFMDIMILNPTSARIFELCNGELTFVDITNIICKEFELKKTNRKIIEKDVEECLLSLKRRMLID